MLTEWLKGLHKDQDAAAALANGLSLERRICYGTAEFCRDPWLALVFGDEPFVSLVASYTSEKTQNEVRGSVSLFNSRRPSGLLSVV